MASFPAFALPCHALSASDLPWKSLFQGKASSYGCATSSHSLGSGFKFGRQWFMSPCFNRTSLSTSRACVPRCREASDTRSLSGEAPTVLDRRQLLLASSLGIAGSQLLPAKETLAEPVQYPDYNQCNNGGSSLDCCLPVSEQITDFKLPTNLPMRARISAHEATSDYIAKYSKAYELLRQLPADDPRQYTQQVNVHCSLCDGLYTEAGTSIEYQVHNSWLFLPWHRWYLYFHERILASLINDDKFALPFWNWDSAGGYTIPPMYVNNQVLLNNNRNSIHLPPTVINLNYSFVESRLSPAQQLAANNKIMYRQLVSNAKVPSLFFGKAYRQGDEASPGAGTVENVPHGTVHSWTGDPNNPNDEDMGALYSAARDPIFFAHHSNVDRLWDVWKSLGGRRKDITDTDWLDTTFLFYDENANLVRVKIADALSTQNLAYTYQKVDNPWIKAQPLSRKKAAASTAMNNGPADSNVPAAYASIKEKIKEKIQEFKERKSNKVDGIVKALVKRPKKVKAADFEEEVLLIEGVEVPTDQILKFDVFVNLPEADEKTSFDISEYAGTFYNLPHFGKHAGMKKVRKSNFRIGVGEVLRELGVEDDENFTVTIVPRAKSAAVPFSIKDVKIEYE
eukprot:c53283_g1_i1 orf=244-2115(-)